MATFRPVWRSNASANQAEYEKEIEQLRRKAPIPSIWLFGKTGSGKSSIIRYLTGAESATIGEGYRPETKTSRRFDFPDSVEPLLSFIDTRGLGKAAYDPQVDIERFESSTQLMLVAIRVTDHSLHSVIEPLPRIRKASPHRPVVLVLTCLHEATGSSDLTRGLDPFATHPKSPSESKSESQSSEIPEGLQTLIDEKTKQFRGLYDVFVPIDLTQKDDGFADPDFGGLRLKQSILEYLPHAYRQALLTLNQTERNESDRQKRARWQVLASSALAATAGAVPLPWVDIPVVLGLQTHLALRIAKIYEQDISPADWAVLTSAAGSRIALRLVVLETLKFIPFLGMAVGAAGSFAFTYALGMSWDWYCVYTGGTHSPDSSVLDEVVPQLVEHMSHGHSAAILRAFYQQLSRQRFQQLATQVIGLLKHIGQSLVK